MQPTRNILITACIAILFIGCDGLFKSKYKVAADDVVLASIEDRKMYLSEIDELINANNNTDSVNQVNTYIESWLKKNVVLNEAEEKFPNNVDIDKLVDDYRSSLLLHNYRQKLIEEALDTTITSDQLSEYYAANKEQYLLQTPISKVKIVQVSDKAPRLEKFYRNWKRNDSGAVNKYLEKHAVSIADYSDDWTNEDQLLSLLPNGLFKARDLKKNGDLQKHQGSIEYFIKIYEVIDKGDIAPMAYVQESIKKVIIHNRKKLILENIEQKLYEEYLRANKIKVYK